MECNGVAVEDIPLPSPCLTLKNLQMLLVHLLPVEYAVRFLDYKHRFLTAMHESLFAQRLILILSYTMSIIDCIDCTHILTSSLMIHIK